MGGPKNRNGIIRRIETLQFWSNQTWHFWHIHMQSNSFNKTRSLSKCGASIFIVEIWYHTGDPYNILASCFKMHFNFLFQNTPYLFYLFLESFNVLYVHTRKSYWILWRKRSGFLSTRLLINNSSSQWKSGIWIILLTNCLEKYDSNQQLRAHVSPRVTDQAEATLLRLRISPRNCKRARALFSTLLTFQTQSSMR